MSSQGVDSLEVPRCTIVRDRRSGAVPRNHRDRARRRGLLAPNALPRPNELVDRGIPNTLSADASRGRSRAGLTMIRASGRAPDRTGPGLGRLCAIGIVGLGGVAVAFELLGRH